MEAFDFDPLDEENWIKWKVLMRYYLQGFGLWEFVENANKSTEDKDIEKKQKAYSILILNLSLELLEELINKDITEEECPFAVWKYLVDRFETIKGFARLDALSNFMHLKMNIDESPDDYISKFHKCVRRANMAGFKLSEELIYMKFVEGIPDKELGLTRIFLAIDNLNLDQAKNMLKNDFAHYMIEKEEKEKMALLAGQKKKQQNQGNRLRKCRKCGLSSHLAKDCDPSLIRCFKCICICARKTMLFHIKRQQNCLSFVSLFLKYIMITFWTTKTETTIFHLSEE